MTDRLHPRLKYKFLTTLFPRNGTLQIMKIAVSGVERIIAKLNALDTHAEGVFSKVERASRTYAKYTEMHRVRRQDNHFPSSPLLPHFVHLISVVSWLDVELALFSFIGRWYIGILHI